VQPARFINGIVWPWRLIGFALLAGLCESAPETGFPGATFDSGIPPAGEARGGEWATAEGAIRHAGAGETPGLLLLEDAIRSACTVEARVRLEASAVGAAAGLVLQYTEPGNYALLTLEQRRGGPYAVLSMVTPDGKKTVGDQSWLTGTDLAQWHTLTVQMNGSAMVASVDGQPAARFWFRGEPPAYNSHGRNWEQDPEAGRIGVYALGRAVFDDIRVGPLEADAELVTPQRGRWDADGRLLAQQSYDETMDRTTDWLLRSDAVVDKSLAAESIRSLPPYVLANFVLSNDSLYEPLGGEFAFNHAWQILGIVQYYNYTGDRDVLKVATEIADWHLENLTPDDWALPNLPPSVVTFEADGRWRGIDWGLELDKSAYFGLALLRLHAATGDARYRQAALDIGETLRPHQRDEGNWPFRINAQTGEVQDGYTCSQLWYVWFFERLARETGDPEDQARSDRALAWLLEHPVRDNQWIGLYGDIESGRKSLDQWVAQETAMHLLERRNEIPGAVETARGILDWVERTLVVDYGLHPGVPGVLEQTEYRVVLTHHQLRLAELYATLYAATGEEALRRKAIETANSVTWCVMSDGKMRQGFWYHAAGVPLQVGFNMQFCRIMAAVPETAPRDENHLLQWTADLRRIEYGADGIRYETIGPGEETFVVARPPRAVRAGGGPLAQRERWGFGLNGWRYEPETGRLRLRHEAPSVEITFE